MNPITKKLLIVTADESVAAKINEALKKSREFLVRKASDGKDAVAACKADRPDAVVIDLHLPDMTCIEAMQAMSKIHAAIPFVVLSTRRGLSAAVETIRCGAYDFVTKPVNSKRLLAVLTRAMSAPIRCRFDVQYNGHKPLTPREYDVLRLTIEGLSSTKIAEQLSISHRTVETHRENILQKLNIKNKTELIRFAVLSGIFHLAPASLE